MLEKLEFDYLRNKKSFRIEIKKHFTLFHKSSLLNETNQQKCSGHNL